MTKIANDPGGGTATLPNIRWGMVRLIEGSPGFIKRLRIVQTPWLGIYLHWIYRPDEDRDPHDHPWPFISIILRGGYTERVFTGRNTGTLHVRQRWSLHVVPTAVAHQILTVAPHTVSLVLIGKHQREWGFWTQDGFAPWREYKQIGVGPDPFGL